MSRNFEALLATVRTYLRTCGFLSVLCNNLGSHLNRSGAIEM